MDSNHPMVKEMITKPSNNSIIEIDMDYIHATINANEGGVNRPINPKLLLIMEQSSAMIFNQKMITPDIKEEQAIVDLLLDYISNYHRPKAIHFKLSFIGVILRDICKKLQVPLVQTKKLPLSQSYFDEITHHFRF